MATVWAPYAGIWNKDSYFGWSNVLAQIRSLADMLEKLKATFPQVEDGEVKEGESNRHRGPVTKLGIVAHGDEGGLVQLPATNNDHMDLTLETLKFYKRDLLRLARYLTPDAFVIFFACASGMEPRGDDFLNALSQLMPGRTFVAFEVWGEIDEHSTNVPGNLIAVNKNKKSELLIDTTINLQRLWSEREYPQEGGKTIPGGGTRRLDEHGQFAKWSLNGAIKRIGKREQDKRLNNLCANPACPGHRFAGERCELIEYGPAPEIRSKDYKPKRPNTPTVPPVRGGSRDPAGQTGVRGSKRTPGFGGRHH